KAESPRAEIRPEFECVKGRGESTDAVLIIRADGRDGLDGHWERRFPVQGGHYYQFRAVRSLENVRSPRRSALVRILWRDERGEPVYRDEAGATSYAPGKPPLAEPEYPTESGSNGTGPVELVGVYQAPSKASHAIIELYLRW